MFSKILVANRGEIAVRIIRACKEMGILTVAIYSQADADALHVSLADQCICVGRTTPSQSYLSQRDIISAALVTGAQAIHPGYGFLSENASFADLCKEYGIVFIGPEGETISKLGDKDAARRLMKEAGVPTVPGSDIITDESMLISEAKRIGFPLLIKARSGGGGKGIRLVSSEDELLNAFRTASGEALSAFGDGGVYMEKFLSPVKHVEVQLLADEHGNVVALGERECSIQLNNQKLIEESPSPAVSAALREKMTNAAIKAAKAAKYTNAGTVEFLLDKDGNFYFMEMNTRLQVEHPVSEYTTGIDIVKWQIRIAAGVELAFKQEDIRIGGAAIECRINARGSGTVGFMHVPGGPWVRFDTALYSGYTVPPFYDSMVGKLIVFARTREEAIRKMHSALCELVLEGIPNNIDEQLNILNDKDFKAGDYYTDFMTTRSGNLVDLKGLFKKPLIELEKGGRTPVEATAADTLEPQKICPACGIKIAESDLPDMYYVCTCGHHFRMNARQRIDFICDEGTFSEMFSDFESHDIIGFPGYDKKLRDAKLSSGENEAVICGTASIKGNKCAIFVMESLFMMGSMGTVVGEKITLLFEHATKENLPVVGFTVSGGARMQEGILSLMQMAKTSGAVKLHSDSGNFYLTVLTDPTTGGVTASFAMLGDIIMAEPGATVGFAGARVIEQTIRKKLPQGFQTSEFLLEHGFIDLITPRANQKRTIATLLSMHKKGGAVQ